MNLSITIEVDNAAPEIELCGMNCKFISKEGKCKLFDIPLEDYSRNKIDDFNGKDIIYDNVKIIKNWERCAKCIHIFYSYGDS